MKKARESMSNKSVSKVSVPCPRTAQSIRAGQYLLYYYTPTPSKIVFKLRIYFAKLN